MEVLHDVYAQGSQLGIPMGDHGLGKAYVEDFRWVIGDWLGDELSGATLLEIGCGSGHLLKTLKEAGAEVSGVEPDRRCQPVMERCGIPVAICEFEDFNPPHAYDCIVHYCVLEHAVDPVAFLRRQKSLLNAEGRIICAVPDCGAALEDGDISIFIHQHWSYFSASSLRQLAAAAGFQIESQMRASVGSLLYVSMVPIEGAGGDGAAGGEKPGENRDPGEFVACARRGIARLDAYVKRIAGAGRSLGIYCPTRAINYVSERSPGWRSVRLFDDAPALLGRYVPPFTAPIESGGELAKHGVDEILIMSRAFGPAIEAAIVARRLDPVPRVRHIADVLSHD